MKCNFLLLLSLLVCFQLSGQIINVEDKRSNLQKDTSDFLGQFDFGLNLFENSSSILTINSGLQLEYQHGNNLFISLSKYDRAQRNGSRYLHEGFQHFRYNRALSPSWTLEAFTQGQFNEAIRLDFRGLLGAGARLNLLKNHEGQQKFYLGLSYMYEYEEVRDTSLQNNSSRLSTYLS